MPAKFQLTKDNSIKVNSSYNVLLALKHDHQLNTSLRYNEFNEDSEIVKPINLGGTKYEVGELPSDFESVLAVYFEQELDVVFTGVALRNGLDVFFSQKKYNPVKEYMEDCFEKWDGKSRINTLFSKYLGSEKTELIENISLIFLVAAVKKVYEPDFKFDYVLDLVGGQGIGKTSILQKLGGPWYTDSITDFQNKDNFELMIRSLIVNDDEMVASKKIGFAELKSFITKTNLRFRKAYARRAQEYPKKFVIARTTNEVAYLRDKTGERRFLPVMVGVEKQERHPMEMTDELVKQIWGEAMTLYQGGYPTTFSKEEEAELEIYREQFMYIDEIENLLDEYLDMKVPSDWSMMNNAQKYTFTQKYLNSNDSIEGVALQDKIATRDILANVFDSDAKNQKLAKKINYLMTNKTDWISGKFYSNKKQTRGFIRKK
ncbi:virulence-associated E family protein [Lactococcus lactis]|uniref:virulence-associated E family protein n=1 Tax=Lactococcus lactis TaxID=1358 RepID=UPI001F0F72E9|nr:virulence-associated E family protein [Lactococcus lactis]MCH5428454.1 virulence-associated E family protein [Lactococcus lactis]MCT0085367.1 helicase [Lactococcus lactis subsp. lactis]